MDTRQLGGGGRGPWKRRDELKHGQKTSFFQWSGSMVLLYTYGCLLENDPFNGKDTKIGDVIVMRILSGSPLSPDAQG